MVANVEMEMVNTNIRMDPYQMKCRPYYNIGKETN